MLIIFCSQSSCTICPEGTYSNEDRSKCVPCPAGSISPAGSASCDPCHDGHISAKGYFLLTQNYFLLSLILICVNSQSSCSRCPEGTYSSDDKSTCLSWYTYMFSILSLLSPQLHFYSFLVNIFYLHVSLLLVHLVITALPVVVHVNHVR